MLNKRVEVVTLKENQERVINELAKAGILVRPGQKKPTHGMYSSVINTRKKKLVFKF